MGALGVQPCSQLGGAASVRGAAPLRLRESPVEHRLPAAAGGNLVHPGAARLGGGEAPAPEVGVGLGRARRIGQPLSLIHI
eukprot:8984964-Pyramimonas_sp.AAC.1